MFWETHASLHPQPCMKRFLKPTGQILTTAVFTSTALEPFAAAAAQPAPAPPVPEGDSQTHSRQSAARQASIVDAKTKTIVPPEASSPREFLQEQQENSSQRSGLFRSASHSQVDALQPIRTATSWSASAPSLPTSNEHTRLPIASNFLKPSPQSTPQLLAESAPSLPSDNEEHEQRLATQMRAQVLAQAEPESSTSTRSVEFSAPSHRFASDLASDSVSSNASGHGAATQPSNIDQTRAWLDDTLATLVERDRSQREAQLRANLLDSAHQHLGRRNIAAARRIADNPALSEAERTELIEAIADVEDSRLYPFVSAERAAAARTQVREMPSQEWLVARMNDYVNSNDADCVAISASSTGELEIAAHAVTESHWAHSSAAQAFIDEEFVSGGEFLAGVGHQAPSMHGNKSDRPIDRAVRGSGGSSATQSASTRADALARTNPCTPTLGQHIGGVTFATLSGYEHMNQSVEHQNHWQMIFPLPVSAPITSRFGWRTHPIYGNRRFHFGVDFGAPTGTPVLAALPGRVQTSGHLRGYGLTIVVENEELQQRNLYAHMSRLAVPAGTWVEQGEVIGWVGSTGNSTGPHLHFEVHHRSGNDWTAVDPLQAAAQMLANRRRN